MLETRCALPRFFGHFVGDPPLLLRPGDLAVMRKLHADDEVALLMSGGSDPAGEAGGHDDDGDEPGDDDPIVELADVVPIPPLPSYAVPGFVPTGEALAAEFAERHRNDYRYVERFGRWMVWNGKAWRADDTGNAINAAGTIAREIGAALKKKGERVRIESSAAVFAMERRARALLAGTVEQWDANPWLLNGPAGTIELDRCIVRPHRIGDFCTKLTAASPGGECPIWINFLHKVTDNDQALIDFLQRMAGYCATGVTTEQCLFFLYGTGQNGKGTFTHTLANILGDYAAVAAIETFTAGSFERHPEELAVLRGARLVLASETEQGKSWSESKIKLLTGGDRIRARFMRQDSFEYLPAFKLIISGNHKPTLRSINKAILRRFHLIPFTVEISDAERDDNLEDRLRHEYAGILRWVLAGAERWHLQGLAPPASVTAATADYIDDEDAIGQWMAECTVADPNSWTSSAHLFGSWKDWAEARGEYVGSIRWLAGQLEARGVKSWRKSAARGFRGQRLKSQYSPTCETNNRPKGGTHEGA